MKKIVIFLIIIFIILLVNLVLKVNLKITKEKIKETNKLAVIIKDESNQETTLSSFPSKPEYILEKVICDGEQIEATDTGTTSFNINLTGITKKSICTYYFIIDSFEYTETFTYITPVHQSWSVPQTGNYRIELWGAQGGRYNEAGGRGGYTAGTINLVKNQELYMYIGAAGFVGAYQGSPSIVAYNGGGRTFYTEWSGWGGGGATDIRLVSGDWDESVSLQSRIMVAAAGGGAGNATAYTDVFSGSGGGLIGDTGVAVSYNNTYNTPGSGATQTLGYQFGVGQDSTSSSNGNGAGGGGYWGGFAGSNDNINWLAAIGGGGSSYISGHTGAVAIQGSEANPSAPLTPRTGTGGVGCTTGINDNLCSVHYSGKVFTNTKMIDGRGNSWTNVVGEAEAMPNPLGGTYELNTGHAGNGYVRIIYINPNAF